MNPSTHPEPPGPHNGWWQDHARLLAVSHQQSTGRRLGGWDPADQELGRKLWEAPFVQLSHGTEADPVFNYGNLAALERFAIDWKDLVRLPSRYSAEAPERGERERLLEAVRTRGYIDDYQGIRIAADGTRFRILRATVWTVTGSGGTPRGQAAWFDTWEPEGP